MISIYSFYWKVLYGIVEFNVPLDTKKQSLRLCLNIVVILITLVKWRHVYELLKAIVKYKYQ